MKTVEKIVETIILIGVGWAAASVFWASKTPDQPIYQPCVPIYDQTGLECCQNQDQ